MKKRKAKSSKPRNTPAQESRAKAPAHPAPKRAGRKAAPAKTTKKPERPAGKTKSATKPRRQPASPKQPQQLAAARTDQPAQPVNETEPTMRQGAPLPVMFIVLLGCLLYLGDLYLMKTAGQFDPRVYYPYQSAQQLDDLAPKSEADAAYAQGRKVYNYICVQCHQANGQGNPAMFIPPLVGSEWVLAEEPGRLIRIVYKGLNGPLTVKGESFGQAAMFAVGDQLPGDDEAKAEQVAAVLTYIRSTWGNTAPPVPLDRVKQAHEKFKDRTDPWTADELLKIPESE